MKTMPSMEAHLAALDKILDCWRSTQPATEFYRQCAVAEIKKLGYSEADASRWLAGALRRPGRVRTA